MIYPRYRIEIDIDREGSNCQPQIKINFFSSWKNLITERVPKKDDSLNLRGQILSIRASKSRFVKCRVDTKKEAEHIINLHYSQEIKKEDKSRLRKIRIIPKFIF